MPRTELTARARAARAIRQSGVLAPGDRVAVAVSGGSDSVALAWLVHHGAAALGCSMAGLIHVNHGLRGDAAVADEAFCRALAGRLGVPFDVSHVDVAALARKTRRSIEATARDARYACFAEAATRLRANRIATGHTLDDQAETVLLRLLRGAGSRGLAGIRRRRGAIVRPLLDCRRADLRAYLADLGETFREDASNDDTRIPRNRIRHDLLPVIDRIAPAGRRALARLAALAGDDEDFFRQVVIESTPNVVLPDGGIRLDVLRRLPPAVARRLVRSVIESAAPDAALGARHLAAVLKLATATGPAGHLDLPGVQVERRGDELVVLRTPPPASPAGPAARGHVQFEYVLPCPGAVSVPEADVTVLASAPDTPSGSGLEWPYGGNSSFPAAIQGLTPVVAAVGLGSIVLPFVVRNRRAGDRFRPLGAPGRRKVQDLMVDRKVPRDERDRVPIVTDASGRIVWVAGLAVAEECRVTARSAGVVILSLKKGIQ